MTLHMLSTATLTGARKLRPGHLIAAVAGAALAIGVTLGAGHWHGATQSPSAHTVSTRSQPAVTVANPRGGVAEGIGDSRGVVVPARGGAAEALAGSQPAFVPHTVDAAAAVPAHGGAAEAIAAGVGSPSEPAIRARGGMTEAIAEAQHLP